MVLAEQAIRANPGISAVQTRIRALQQRVQRAGAWMDPVAAVEYGSIPIDSGALGDSPMSGLQFKLQQTFFFPGKIALREEVAKGQVKEERHLLAERKVQLAAMVQRAYYSLALVRHLRQVTQSHIQLIDQFIDVVRIKYEVGKVGQHDLLRLQVLRTKLSDDLNNFDRDDRSLTAAINASLHRPGDTPIKTPKRIQTPTPPTSFEELIGAAIKHRPKLQHYLEQARTRRLEAKRLAREGYPDLTTWIGYRLRTEAGADPGTDFFSVGVSVPIPLSYDRRWRSQSRENEHGAQEAEQQREAEIDRIKGELGQHLATWRRSLQEAETYRKSLMPQARSTLDATFAAYQVDRADFASLFQSEIQLLGFERIILRAEAGAALSRVNVEALVGRRMEKNHE